MVLTQQLNSFNLICNCCLCSYPLDFLRFLPGPPQTPVIQTLVKTRPSATAWTRTSTVHVLKVLRERPVNGWRRTAKPHRVKVTSHSDGIKLTQLVHQELEFELFFLFFSPGSHWQLYGCYSNQRFSWSEAYLLQCLRSPRAMHQSANRQLHLCMWSGLQRNLLSWKYVRISSFCFNIIPIIKLYKKKKLGCQMLQGLQIFLFRY